MFASCRARDTSQLSEYVLRSQLLGFTAFLVAILVVIGAFSQSVTHTQESTMVVVDDPVSDFQRRRVKVARRASEIPLATSSR